MKHLIPTDQNGRDIFLFGTAIMGLTAHFLPEHFGKVFVALFLFGMTLNLRDNRKK